MLTTGKPFTNVSLYKKQKNLIPICKLLKLKAIAYSYGNLKTINNEYTNYQDFITD